MNKLVSLIISITLIFCFLVYDLKNSSLYFFWILGGSVIAVYLLREMLRMKLARSTLKLVLYNTAWLFWCLFSLNKVIDQHAFWSFFIITLFYTILCCIIVPHIISTPNYIIRKSLVSIIMCWLVFSFLGLVFFVLTGSEGDFSSFYSNRNVFSYACLCIIFAMMFYQEFSESRFKLDKKIYFVILAVLIFFIVITKSMKALFSLAIIYFIINSKLSIRNLFKFIFLALTLFVLIFGFENPISERVFTFIYAFTNPSTLGVSESSYIRLNLILDGLLVIKDNPIFGVGFNQSQFYLFPDYNILLFERGEKEAIVGQYSHNNYIEVALNGGIPALIIYYLPLISSVYYLIKRRGLITSRQFRMILAAIFVKVFYDYGMVSYKEFFNILFITFIYYFCLVFTKRNIVLESK